MPSKGSHVMAASHGKVFCYSLSNPLMEKGFLPLNKAMCECTHHHALYLSLHHRWNKALTCLWYQNFAFILPRNSKFQIRSSCQIEWIGSAAICLAKEFQKAESGCYPDAGSMLSASTFALPALAKGTGHVLSGCLGAVSSLFQSMCTRVKGQSLKLTA